MIRSSSGKDASNCAIVSLLLTDKGYPLEI